MMSIQDMLDTNSDSFIDFTSQQSTCLCLNATEAEKCILKIHSSINNNYTYKMHFDVRSRVSPCSGLSRSVLLPYECQCKCSIRHIFFSTWLEFVIRTDGARIYDIVEAVNFFHGWMLSRVQRISLAYKKIWWMKDGQIVVSTRWNIRFWLSLIAFHRSKPGDDLFKNKFMRVVNMWVRWRRSSGKRTDSN